jgi:hypothetical protein
MAIESIKEISIKLYKYIVKQIKLRKRESSSIEEF